jgi:hypothetical protein
MVRDLGLDVSKSESEGDVLLVNPGSHENTPATTPITQGPSLKRKMNSDEDRSLHNAEDEAETESPMKRQRSESPVAAPPSDSPVQVAPQSLGQEPREPPSPSHQAVYINRKHTPSYGP